jgi:hypothetical protein
VEHARGEVASKGAAEAGAGEAMGATSPASETLADGGSRGGP